MMLQLCYEQKAGLTLQIADELALPGCNLRGLQQLVGGKLVSEESTADVCLLPVEANKAPHVVYVERTNTFRHYCAVPGTEREQVIIWRRALINAIQGHVLRDMPVILMHGCLLQADDGEGILLCGQSGMGKTTTAKRWKASGGRAPADDMILLEFSGKTMFAHPLPTWSRCVESLEGEFYPFEESIPLKTILALNRDSEKEEIREVEGYAFLSAIYASCILFNLNPMNKGISPRGLKIIDYMKRRAQFLYDSFPHRTLFANLNGNLRKTIEEAKL